MSSIRPSLREMFVTDPAMFKSVVVKKGRGGLSIEHVSPKDIVKTGFNGLINGGYEYSITPDNCEIAKTPNETQITMRDNSGRIISYEVIRPNGDRHKVLYDPSGREVATTDLNEKFHIYNNFDTNTKTKTNRKNGKKAKYKIENGILSKELYERGSQTPIRRFSVDLNTGTVTQTIYDKLGVIMKEVEGTIKEGLKHIK